MLDLSSTRLLSINDICEKLSISRQTLDRWRGISSPKSPNTNQNSPSFPEPDAYLGESPRWTIETVNKFVDDSTQQERNNRSTFKGRIPSLLRQRQRHVVMQPNEE